MVAEIKSHQVSWGDCLSCDLHKPEHAMLHNCNNFFTVSLSSDSTDKLSARQCCVNIKKLCKTRTALCLDLYGFFHFLTSTPYGTVRPMPPRKRIVPEPRHILLIQGSQPSKQFLCSALGDQMARKLQLFDRRQ